LLNKGDFFSSSVHFSFSRMAPEVIMAMETGTYSYPVDIWSLGITLIGNFCLFSRVAHFSRFISAFVIHVLVWPILTYLALHRKLFASAAILTFTSARTCRDETSLVPYAIHQCLVLHSNARPACPPSRELVS